MQRLKCIYTNVEFSNHYNIKKLCIRINKKEFRGTYPPRNPHRSAGQEHGTLQDLLKIHVELYKTI